MIKKIIFCDHCDNKVSKNYIQVDKLWLDGDYLYQPDINKAEWEDSHPLLPNDDTIINKQFCSQKCFVDWLNKSLNNVI